MSTQQTGAGRTTYLGEKTRVGGGGGLCVGGGDALSLWHGGRREKSSGDVRRCVGARNIYLNLSEYLAIIPGTFQDLPRSFLHDDLILELILR